MQTSDQTEFAALWDAGFVTTGPDSAPILLTQRVFDPFDQTPEEMWRDTLAAASIVVDRDSMRPMKTWEYQRLMTTAPRS